MILANIALLLLSAAGLSSASHCGTNSTTNSSCLHVGLYDMFREGWDGARHYLERPDGSVVSRAPTCNNTPVVFDVCPDEGTGLYYMVVQHEDEGYIPFHYWEILWKVQVETDCNGTEGILRTGGFNTTMVWHYEEDGDAWTLVYWKNLWENTKECDACGDAKKCKPKPKHHKKKKKPKHKKGKGSDGTETGTGTNTTGTGTNTTKTNTTGTDTAGTETENTRGHHLIKKGKHDKSKHHTHSHGKKGHRALAIPPDFDDYPRYGPPAVNVKVTMWDEEGDGWWRNDYLGSSWYISDSTRTELFHTGTLCDGFSGECKLCLGDGSYVFRTTGWRTDFQAWQFCGVRGPYHSELSFHIKKGKCYPDVLIDIRDICEGQVSSNVTLHGVIAVSGVASEFFSDAEAHVIASVLSTEVQGWEATHIRVVDAALDARVLSEGRSLATYTHEFAFEVSFTAESAFGVDGKNYEAVNDLIETIHESLEDVASSGQFAADLASAATLSGVSVLREVRAVELVSLELASITYSGAKEMTIYEETEDEDYLSSGHGSRDYTAVAVFLSALGVALVAFVGVVAHRSKGYNKLEQDSTHVKEVMPAEMDSTISPLSGNFAAREKPIASAL